MPDSQNAGGFIVALVTLPFLIFIGILVLATLRNVRKSGRSKRWPSIEGRVITSEVVSRRSLDSSGTHTTIYEPSIRYAFNLNGQRFESKTISFGGIAGTSAPDFAESVVAKYPAGSSVEVFYNSAKPTESVLEHSGSGVNMALLIIFSVIELGLLALLVLGLTGRFT